MLRNILALLLIGFFLVLVVASAVTANTPDTWPYFVGFSIASTLLMVAIWRWAVPSKWVIIVLAIALRVVFSYLPPILSDDAYRYVWDGVLLSDGVNPYLYKPSSEHLEAYQDKPIYPELNSAEFYSVYPRCLNSSLLVEAYFMMGIGGLATM